MKHFYVFLVLLLIGNFGFGQITENFDSGLASSYTTGNQTLTSGTWATNQVFAEIAGNSRGATGSAARLNKNTADASLTTPTLSGAGTITFWYRALNLGDSGTLSLQTSTDGTTYTTETTQAYSTTTYTQFTYVLDSSSPTLTIRILNDNQNAHLIIDDFDATAPPGGSGSTINITTSGGSYASEKWVSITTLVDGGGTQIWGQGDGSYGNGEGLINQDINLPAGTYYVNCYDKYSDGWDGTLISVTAYGSVIGDNGGVSPSDPTTNDSTGSWETPADELEASFQIIVPNPPSCIDISGLAIDSFTDTTAAISWTANNAETDWQIVVQPDGTGAPSGNGPSTTTNPHTQTGLTAETDYEVYVRANCGTDGFANWAGPVTFTTAVACLPVSDLSVSSITTDTAAISWTANDGETAWEIAVQADGTGIPTGSGTPTTNNPYSATLLTANTAYEVYVRANCGTTDGFSEWVGPIDFNTACNAISTLPFTENVETTSATLSCWTINNNNNDTDSWSVQTSATYANSGSQSFQMYTDGNSGANDDYLISPQITLTGNERLKFQQRVRSSGEPNDFAVLLSTTGNAPADFTNTILANTSYSNTAYQEIEIDLSAYTGNVHIAFHVPPAGLDGWYLYIDDITVEAIPACLEVSGITIDSFTGASATVSWTAGGAETDWEIAIQADGTGVPTGAGVATSTNPHTDATISSNTAYEVYVRADCDTNGFSPWVGPVDFTTPCGNIVPDYTADMSNNVPDNCWEEAGSGEVATGPSGIGASGWGTGSYGVGSSNKVNLYQGNVQREWLLSPTFDLSTGGPFQLEINTAVLAYNSSTADGTMGSDDEVQLLSSSDGGTTWVNITTWNAANEPLHTGTEYIADLTAFTGNVQFAIWASDGTVDDAEDYDFHVGKFVVRTPPSCLEVSGITIDSFTSTTADISWTAGDTETAWEIVVQADGTGVPTAAGTPTTTNPHSESGLTAQTAYEVYVRANCGSSYSTWVGPITFTTLCTSLTAPYTEDFENAGTIPSCWTSSSSNSRVWAFATTPTFGNTYSDNTSGSGYFAFVDASTVTTTTDATLTSPLIDVSGLTTPALEFYVHHYVAAGTNSNTITVEVFDGAAWNTVYTDNNGDVNGWESVLIDLSTLTITGDVQVRFVMDTATNSNYENDIAIDDVAFKEAPTCFDPIAITIDSFTDSTAEVSWTPGSGQTDWEVVVQADGTGVPAAAGTPTTLNPYSHSGLTELTTYEVYVRADCGAGGFSGWAGPVDFTTTAACPDLSNLTIDNFTDNQATISWTTGVSTAWEIVVQADGTGVPTTGTATTTNPYTETGLTEQTAYEVYVRADCTASSNGYSNWVGPIDFTTTCKAIVPEYLADMSNNVPDSCWEEASSGEVAAGPSSIGFSSWGTGSYGIGASNKVNLYQGNVQREWLLSPVFDLSSGGPFQLEVNAAVTAYNNGSSDGTMGSDDEVQLLSSIDGGVTWVNVTTWNATNEPLHTGTELTEDLTAFTGDIQFAIWASDGTVDDAEDYDFHVGKFRVRAIPSCDDVTSLILDSVTDTTAAISWTAGGTETDWEIVVQADGTGVPTGAGTPTTNNPYPATGLTAQTAYEVYVRADCDANGFSAWVGPLDFTTDCATITTLPFTEDVETTSTTLPCWRVLNNNGDGDTWSINSLSTYANSGNQSFQMYTDFNNGANDDYLISPKITLTGNELLKFQQRVRSSGEPNDFAVLLSTTGSSPADFTNTLIANTSYSNTTYQELTADLSAFTGDVYIAFHIPPGGLDGYYLYLDDITVEALPACPEISSLTIDSTTESSATISWTAIGGTTNWEIAVQADGTGVPTSNGTTTSTNPYTDSTLTGNTAYEVYVRADCTAGTNGYSDWIGPVTFTTPCGIIVPDYTADMSTNVPDACWEEAGNGEVAAGPGGVGASDWTTGTYGLGSSNKVNLYQGNTKREWLLSPTFDLSTGGPFQLEINTAVTAYNNGNSDGTMGSDDEVQLLSTTDGGTTWVNITTWNAANEPLHTGTEYIADLTAYTGNVQFAIWASDGVADDSEDYDFHIGQFIVRVPPTCLEVSAVTIDSFTTSEVTVSWTNGDTETNWEVAVQADGTGVPAAAGSAATTNPHTESGLTDNTAYEVYVRANCLTNGFSAWVGPVDFTTPCDAIVPSYNADMSTNVPDSCWEEAGSGEVAAGPGGLGSSDWTTGSYAVGPSNKINLWQSVDREWLLSPTFDLSTGGPFQLEVNVAVTNYASSTVGDTMGSDDEVQLLSSTDGGTTWVNITTWNAANQPALAGTEYTADLTAMTGNVQFAIWASDGTVDDSEDYDFHVGKFRVRAIPTCPDVTALTIDTVTRTSVDVSWTAGGAETAWEIVVQADGTGIPTGNGTAVNTTPTHTDSSLTAATAYEVYVRANCGPGDLSEWIGPLDFTTLNPIPTTAITLNVSDCGISNADSYNGAYDASTENVVWAQLNYTGSCSELTIDTIGSDFDTEIGIYDANGVLIGSNDTGTGVSPQSLFTELALANGTYYIAAGMYNVTFGADFAVTSSNTSTTGTLYINAGGPSAETVDFCNLQSPNSGNITEGATHTVYAQIYEAGVTNGVGQGANIEAWIGYSTTDASTTADFTSSNWTWVPATYNTDVGIGGNDDEYQAEIGSTLTPGLYYYASRFNIDGGAYAYGGITPNSTGGNFWDGTSFVSGQLTVNAGLPTTVATLTINGCGASDSYSGAYDASVQGITWVELVYDGNCSDITVDTETTTFDTEIGLYDSSGNLLGSDDDGGTGTLSSLTQGLAAGTYYVAAGRYNVSFGAFFNVTTSNSSQTGTIGINASTPNAADFCNLQSPNTGSIVVGDNFDVYARVYEAGVTDGAGQGANISAWIGYSETNATTSADFTSSDWTWVAATYNVDAGNDDEYQAEIGSTQAIGTYYYVSRFTVDNGAYTYGGITPNSTGGNFWDGTNFVSGVLTVNPLPEPTNHALTFTAVPDSFSEITLTWNDNDGAQPADGFLIVGKTGTGTFYIPVDGTDDADDTDWSDDEAEVKVLHGVQTYTVTGLTGSTLYDFEIYPYTNTGSVIDYKTDGTIPSTSATTLVDPCTVAVTTFPFTEGFEGATFAPDCWSSFRGTNGLGTINDWESQTVNVNTGTTAARVSSETVTGGNAEDWLVTVPLDLSSLTAPELTFFAREEFAADYGTIYTVRISTTNTNISSFTTVATYTEANMPTTFTEFTVDLTAYTNDTSVYIAFVVDQNNGDTFYLDDITVDGATAQTYTYNGSWSPSDPNGTSSILDNIIVTSGDAPITTNTNIKTVTVNAGAGLNISSGTTLTVDDVVTLESVSNNYSSLIYDGTIVGTIKYKRYVNANSNGNDLISPPLSGETWANFLLSDTNAADLLDNGQTSPTTYAFAPYVKPANTFNNFTSATTATLNGGTGYRAATDTGTTLTFTGTVPTTSVGVNIEDIGPNHPDWNLIGNPYPSYVDVFSFLSYDNGGGVTNIDLLEDTSGIYGYDGDSSNGWDIITNANSFGRYLAPGQGFFVAANDAQVAAHDITFNPSMRATATTVTNNFGSTDDFIAGRSTSNELTYFKLNASTSSNDYTTQFYFNDESSQGADHGYDGKLWGSTAPDFALYSNLVQDNVGVPMALQSLNTSDMMDVVIPLGVNANSGEQLTFTISESVLPSTVEVYLDDTLNNTSTLLNSSDYVITPATNLNGTGRFYLRVTDTALSTTDEDFNSIKIYTEKSPRSIFVHGTLNADTVAKVYDLQGRLVSNTELESRHLLNEIDASKLQDGVYVVTLSNGIQEKSQKVIIR